jgi:hypothetical protein
MTKQKATDGVAEEPAAPIATPETTSVPGGGSWHWDYSLAGWVSNDTEQPAQE